MYTSNYARHGRHPNAYAISKKAPDWYIGKHIPELYPDWNMIMDSKNGKITEHEYSEMYFNLLLRRGVNAHDLVNKLQPDAILLCYEAPFTFCHRRLVAMWIENETGVQIPEYIDSNTQLQYNFKNNTLEF